MAPHEDVRSVSLVMLSVQLAQLGSSVSLTFYASRQMTESDLSVMMKRNLTEGATGMTAERQSTYQYFNQNRMAALMRDYRAHGRINNSGILLAQRPSV